MPSTITFCRHPLQGERLIFNMHRTPLKTENKFSATNDPRKQSHAQTPSPCSFKLEVTYGKGTRKGQWDTSLSPSGDYWKNSRKHGEEDEKNDQCRNVPLLPFFQLKHAPFRLKDVVICIHMRVLLVCLWTGLYTLSLVPW